MDTQTSTQTSTQAPIDQATYQRALQRARDEGVTITCHNEADHYFRWWMVSNPSHQDHWYTVWLEREGGPAGRGRLTCDCPAYEHGKYCKHRALVHAALVAERAAERQQTDHQAA